MESVLLMHRHDSRYELGDIVAGGDQSKKDLAVSPHRTRKRDPSENP